MDLKNSARYITSEDENYEPGSNNQVLKNYLGVTSVEVMAQLEVREFERTEKKMGVRLCFFVSRDDR